MSIQELSLKLKGFLQNTEVLLAILIVVVSLCSFFLGRLSVQEEMPEMQGKIGSPQSESNKSQIIGGVVGNTATIPEPKEEKTTQQSSAGEQSGYVASKSGTKYHLPWCGSAKQIKEENKIWFATKAEAEKAGYTPASNCKGI